MNIKILHQEDWLEWKNLRLEALYKNPEAFGSSYEEEYNLPDNEFKKSLKKNKVFGAFISNQLVGCAGFFIHKLIKMQHRGVLFGMYVKSENRNFHICDELVKTVQAYAKDHVSQIHLTVVKDNLPALKLYEKHGFKIYGTEPCSLKISDQSYDEHLMVLTF